MCCRMTVRLTYRRSERDRRRGGGKREGPTVIGHGERHGIIPDPLAHSFGQSWTG